jgi:hypothetical protein
VICEFENEKQQQEHKQQERDGRLELEGGGEPHASVVYGAGGTGVQHCRLLLLLLPLLLLLLVLLLLLDSLQLAAQCYYWSSQHQDLNLQLCH